MHRIKHFNTEAMLFGMNSIHCSDDKYTFGLQEVTKLLYKAKTVHKISPM